MRKNDAIGFPEEDAHCFLEKQSVKLRVKIIKIAWKLKDFSKSEHKINKTCRIFCSIILVKADWFQRVADVVFQINTVFYGLYTPWKYMVILVVFWYFQMEYSPWNSKFICGSYWALKHLKSFCKDQWNENLFRG